MKATAAGRPGTQRKVARPKSAANSTGKIHAVIIYTFRQPDELADLEQLYRLIGRLNRAKDVYARPITVIDRKTHSANEANKEYRTFRRQTVARHSDILDAWGV